MKFFSFVLISILNSIAQSLIRENSFLTADDFKRADGLTPEQIDRGEGTIDTKAQFNANFNGGDIVDKPPSKRKVVSNRND